MAGSWPAAVAVAAATTEPAEEDDAEPAAVVVATLEAVVGVDSRGATAGGVDKMAAEAEAAPGAPARDAAPSCSSGDSTRLCVAKVAAADWLEAIGREWPATAER